MKNKMVKIVSYFIKHLSKYLISLCLVIFFVSVANANYDSFLNDLKKTGIDIESIQSSKTISRYTLTKLLNGVNCKDCINPDSNMINKYTYARWQDFSIGRDFGDISYLGGFYGGESYYFCVAYVGDNVWMRGYPEGTSPVCNGNFCGNRNVTLGEFFQVVLNIADQYVYDRYSVDWRMIENWVNSLQSNSYAYQYLTDDDRNLIREFADQSLNGPLLNEEALQPYLKYCMFNLDACNMQSFGKVGQGYWPVAELNILYDNNIVEFEKFENGQTDKSVEGEYVLQVLYNLFEIIDCDFNYDYDCDGLINPEDNCPNDYNPSQRDTNGDGVGDVCDDDVDGDGIKNLVGIVDDLGHIVVGKWDKKMDNCPLVENKNQKDANKNGVGDACEGNTNLGMYIKINKIENVAPARVEFEAVTKGNVEGDVQWKFSDGSFAAGKKVSHVFDQAGLFAVQAFANGEKNNAIASTTVLIGKGTSDIYAMQIKAVSSTSIPTQISFSLDVKGSFDKFEWNFGDGTKAEKKDKSTISKVYNKEGSYLVTVKGYKNSEIVAVASVIVGAGKNLFKSNMNVSDLNPNIGDNVIFSTSVAGIKESNIKNVLWNFGDGKEERTKELKTYHKYDVAGEYVVIQTINFVDGSKIQNYLTLYVRDKTIENSYAIQVIPSELLGSTAESIVFREERVGSLPDILLNLNEYQLGYTEKSYEYLNVWPKKFEYKYNKGGIFNPTFFVYVDECIDLETTSTLVAVEADTCFDAMINRSLGRYKCDMDDDGVPDICDDDIDGDGIKNLVGIIKYENSDCSITTDNINYDIFLSHKNVCSLDNCPISDNLMQLDINNNGFGDSCDSIVVSISNIIGNNSNYNNGLDSDGDGIIDSFDSCPNIPEKYNGIQDYDGCPEIGLNNNCSISNFKYFDGTFWNNTDDPTIPPCYGDSCDVCLGDIHNCYIIPEDPKDPVMPCIGSSCNNVCTGNVNNCPTCNGDPDCEICLSNPESCSSWTGGVGPYSLTARCEPENIIYNWYNIVGNSFSFNGIFPGSCPCKKCHWYVQDSNGLVTAAGDFEVCNEGCGIIGSGPEDPIIGCTGSNCNNVCLGDVNNCSTCNGDPECELCLLDPESCGNWTGGIGPYYLTARCEPENIIYNWNNIMGNNFSFNGLLPGACPCKTCHWYVKDSVGNVSHVRDFQVCGNGCGIVNDGPDNPVPPCSGSNCNLCLGDVHNCYIIPEDPEDPVMPCTGSSCSNVCTGDINNCWNGITIENPEDPEPGCLASNCDDICVGDINNCQLNGNSGQNPNSDPNSNTDPNSTSSQSGLYGTWSGGTGPYSVYAWCNYDGTIVSHSRFNIVGHEFSFAGYFPSVCPCEPCHRYVVDSNGLSSSIGTFQVCDNSCLDTYDPEPEDECNGDPECELCLLNPESCSSWTGGVGPYSLTARCEPENIIYNWYNIVGNSFSFDGIFPGSCPCKRCHWHVQDSNGLITATGDFQVCNEGCGMINDGPDEPINGCTGSDCNNVCTGNVNNCPTCNGDPECELCLQDPESCGTWTGGVGPYSVTARCEPENIIYNWNNIMGNNFSFNGLLPGACPCKRCYWYVQDSQGNITNTREFEVCIPGCETPPYEPPYACESDPLCVDCLNDPSSLGTRVGGVGPFTVHAWCDDIPDLIYEWYNIDRHNWCFANRLPGSCPCRQCHWYVTDSDGNTSSVRDFQVCNEGCGIINDGPDEPINGCTGSDCNNVCTGNVNNCPTCNGDPECELCLQDPESCGTWTGGVGPYSVTARCEPENIIYNWNNIMGNNFSFNGLLPGACPCKTCYWYVQDSLGNVSYTREFQVCGDDCGHEPPPDPCSLNPFCDDCIENPDNCVPIPGGPAELLVQCEPDLEYYWTNIRIPMFSLANMIPGDCPCRQCQWTSTNSGTTLTGSFQVCEPGCEPIGPGGGDTPIIDPDTPIVVSECLSCPCNYVDFTNSLNIDDKVKAILRDDSMTTLYNRSAPVFLKEFL